MINKDILEVVVNVCLFLILVIPIVWTKWIYDESQHSLFNRLRPGFLVLLSLSIILYFGNHFISKQNDLEQKQKDSTITRISNDLNSLKTQLPANGFIWDSTKNLIKSLYQNPAFVYRDTTNENTDVVLCATDQMKLEVKNKEMDSIWITANFCTTRSVVKNFSFSDRILFKKGSSILVSNSDHGIVNQNWQYGTHDYSLTMVRIEPPYTIRDSIFYFCKYNWSNKEKSLISAPQRILLLWRSEVNTFAFVTNPNTISALTQALKNFDAY